MFGLFVAFDLVKERLCLRVVHLQIKQPLRNRRKGSHTHVGEGMTQYTLDGEVIGYGLSEYLDQPKSDEVNE